MDNGWIKLHRDLLSDEWEWFGDSNTTYLFMCLIMLANHKDGSWRGQPVSRGSLITGRKSLAKKTGLSEQSIRTSLDKLKSTSKLTIKTTNQFSVISIKNYDCYQQINQPNPNEQPTTNQRLTTNKNEKNEKNINTYVSLFNSLFGTKYQPTKGRVDKLKSRLQTYSIEQVLQATENLASSDFHKGKNDRGWVADPDFLIRNDEQIDKWLNIIPEKKAKPKVVLKLMNER